MEHLGELRMRLVRIVVVLIVGCCIFYLAAGTVGQFLLLPIAEFLPQGEGGAVDLQFINALGICGLTALVLEQMDPAFYNIVFNVSAALILLSIFDRQGKTYPTTHHETLVVAYAMAATGANVVLSIAFGMLANLIYLLFARYFNENCDTHIDPPAVAIEICSLILFTCF